VVVRVEALQSPEKVDVVKAPVAGSVWSADRQTVTNFFHHQQNGVANLEVSWTF